MRVARLMVSALVLCPAPAVPQLECVAGSAPAAGRGIVVNADCAGTGPADPTSARLFFSLDCQSSWTELGMNRVAEPGYDSTFGQRFTAPGSGAVFYYVRAENGTNFATQSPYNGANVWPPAEPLLARAADEPADDTVNGARGAWLDLTGIAVGRSDEWFYVRLTNNHNSWPIGTFPGPWYVYSVGFRNPDAPSDTWVYVMSYANVMGIYTSGLYEINDYTEAYTKLSDLETVTQGNRLFMRCRFSDFTGRPRFGPWPNRCGSLFEISGNTQSATMSRQHYQHDTTDHCRFYTARTPFAIVDRNRPPALAGLGVEPRTGTPETEFTFRCRYQDPDSNLPVIRAVVVDDETLRLRPDHHRYWQDVSFDAGRSGFAPGWHRFHFLFDDGMARVTSPPDSFEVREAGVAERPGCVVGKDGLFASPNPFRWRTAIGLRLAAGGPEKVGIFDASGRCVRTLAVRRRPSAVSTAVWDGTDVSGREVAPGLYFCRVAGSAASPLRLVKSSSR